MILLKALSVIFERNMLFYRLIADTTGVMANHEALVVS